jgi:hypothetical protein
VDRYIIGSISADTPLDVVVARFLGRRQGIAPLPGDSAFLDAYDHVVTELLRRAEDDASFGVPFCRGPIAAKIAAGPLSSGFATWNP